MQNNQMKISELNARDIIEWLKEHPNFLNDCPQALEILMPPKENNGKTVIDFQNFMVKKLKSDKEEILSSAKNIVETSRANMQNQSRIQDSILRVLDAHDFDSITQIITMDLPPILNVDIITMVIEAGENSIPHINHTGVRLIPVNTIDSWLNGKNYLLEDNIRGIDDIYGGGANLVASQALFRIDTENKIPASIIAFGSRNPDSFQKGMAIDQISFLTRAIEKTIVRFINE